MEASPSTPNLTSIPALAGTGHAGAADSAPVGLPLPQPRRAACPGRLAAVSHGASGRVAVALAVWPAPRLRGWQTDAGRACAGGLPDAPQSRHVHSRRPKRPMAGCSGTAAAAPGSARPPKPRDGGCSTPAAGKLTGARVGQSSSTPAGPAVGTCHPGPGDPEPWGRHKLKGAGAATRGDWPPARVGQGSIQDPQGPRVPGGLARCWGRQVLLCGSQE